MPVKFEKKTDVIFVQKLLHYLSLVIQCIKRPGNIVLSGKSQSLDALKLFDSIDHVCTSNLHLNTSKPYKCLPFWQIALKNCRKILPNLEDS